MSTSFPILVTIGRLVEFHQLADALCVDELGRLPSHTEGDPVAEIILMRALDGETGEQIRAWLHAQPEAIAHRERPITPALPPIPTRAQVCGVRTHFQGMDYQLSTGPTREVLVWGLPAVDQVAVYDQHKAVGDTHLLVAISEKYYDIPIGAPWNLTADLATFKAKLREVIVAGLTPVCSLAGDGQQFNPDGWTLGWPWLMANMPRIIGALEGEAGSECPDGEDLTSYTLFFFGYELMADPHTGRPSGGGDWQPTQLDDAILLFRKLLPDGYLALQIGAYAWWGDSMRHTGAVGCWDSAVGMGVDTLLGEWANPNTQANPLSSAQMVDRRNSMEQIAARWLGPRANSVRIAPANNGPWYLHRETPRGPRIVVALELSEYLWVRHLITADEVEADRQAFRDLGFSFTG